MTVKALEVVKRESSRSYSDGKRSDGRQNVKSKKEKTNAPPTKVVLRRLPPTMTEEEFLEAINPLPDHDYFTFCPADNSLGPYAFTRVYINFRNPDDILTFKDKFDGYVLVDQKGNEYPAMVEFAPFQKIPKRGASGRKRDGRCGTIEQDGDYKIFLESLANPETVTLPPLEAVLEEIQEHDRLLKANNGFLKIKTPLLEFIEHKKAEKLRSKEEKREERRRKEFERKKAREDEKRKRKEGKDQHRDTSKRKEDHKEESSGIKLQVLRPERVAKEEYSNTEATKPLSRRERERERFEKERQRRTEEDRQRKERDNKGRPARRVDKEREREERTRKHEERIRVKEEERGKQRDEERGGQKDEDKSKHRDVERGKQREEERAKQREEDRGKWREEERGRHREEEWEEERPDHHHHNRAEGAKSKRYSEGRRKEERERERRMKEEKAKERRNRDVQGHEVNVTDREAKERIKQIKLSPEKMETQTVENEKRESQERNVREEKIVKEEKVDKEERSGEEERSVKEERVTREERRGRVERGSNEERRIKGSERSGRHERGNREDTSSREERSSRGEKSSRGHRSQESIEKEQEGREEGPEERVIIRKKREKDPRAERRIRNKDRPAMALYRPGQSRLSSRLKQDPEDGADTSSSSPSPVMPITDTKKATTGRMEGQRETSVTKEERGGSAGAVGGSDQSDSSMTKEGRETGCHRDKGRSEDDQRSSSATKEEGGAEDITEGAEGMETGRDQKHQGKSEGEGSSQAKEYSQQDSQTMMLSIMRPKKDGETCKMDTEDDIEVRDGGAGKSMDEQDGESSQDSSKLPGLRTMTFRRSVSRE